MVPLVLFVPISRVLSHLSHYLHFDLPRLMNSFLFSNGLCLDERIFSADSSLVYPVAVDVVNLDISYEM